MKRLEILENVKANLKEIGIEVEEMISQAQLEETTKTKMYDNQPTTYKLVINGTKAKWSNVAFDLDTYIAQLEGVLIGYRLRKWEVQ